jgi:hypothetical protein
MYGVPLSVAQRTQPMDGQWLRVIFVVPVQLGVRLPAILTPLALQHFPSQNSFSQNVIGCLFLARRSFRRFPVRAVAVQSVVLFSAPSPFSLHPSGIASFLAIRVRNIPLGALFAFVEVPISHSWVLVKVHDG